MINAELAQLFDELADVLEYRGDNPFKLRAYRKAAQVLRDLKQSVTVLAAQGGLRDLPGVGAAIARKIVEYIETGRIERYEEARKAAPDGLLAMLRVPGFTPRVAARAVKALGIASVEELAEAARSGRLKDVPGIGPRKEQEIVRGLQRMTGKDAAGSR